MIKNVMKVNQTDIHFNDTFVKKKSKSKLYYNNPSIKKAPPKFIGKHDQLLTC